MMIFSWILLILAAIYGGLSVYAGITSLKDKKISLFASIFMIIGGFVVLTSVFPDAFHKHQLILLILGLILIQVSAIINGVKLYGKITIRHHIFRLLLSVLIILLYFVKI